MRMPSLRFLYLALAALGLALGGTLQANAASVVNVREGDYGGHLAFKLSTHYVKHGAVTFHDHNTDDDLVHEMVIIRTNLPANKLPYNKKAERVEENKLHGIGEIDDLKPNHKATKTFDLKAGRYVLICNEPGHYKRGMYTVLHVR